MPEFSGQSLGDPAVTSFLRRQIECPTAVEMPDAAVLVSWQDTQDRTRFGAINMASRESQGLQIALIIFVMVTVVLAVTTFVFYRRSAEFAKTAEAAKQSETAARNTYNTENFKVQYLKHILGAARLADAEFKSVRESVLADAEMKSVDDQYQQHMKTYGEGLSPEKLDYANLLPNMMMALRARNKANTDLSALVNQLTEEKKLLQENETKRTQEAVTEMQKAKDDLASERDGFQKSRDSLTSQQQEQLKAFESRLAKLTGEVDTVKKADDETGAAVPAGTDPHRRTEEEAGRRPAAFVRDGRRPGDLGQSTLGHRLDQSRCGGRPAAADIIQRLRSRADRGRPGRAEGEYRSDARAGRSLGGSAHCVRCAGRSDPAR